MTWSLTESNPHRLSSVHVAPHIVSGETAMSSTPLNGGSSALSAKERQRLDTCHRRGKELAVQHDVDYAHEMFLQCVLGDPGNLAYVESLLDNLRAKYDVPSKKFFSIFRSGVNRALKNAVDTRDYRLALKLGLDALGADPWHAPTLHVLANICATQHFNEVELVYLKQALQGSPKDADVNRHCARSLARMGQFDQAIACWHRIEEIRGKDREATEMISRLTEEKMKYPGGKPPAGSKSVNQVPRTETTEETQDVQSVQSLAEIPIAPRQRLEQAIEADPADVGNYLKLAELLCDMERYENAERTLMRAMDYCVQRQLIEDALARVRVQRGAAEREAAELERQRELRAQRKGLRVPWLELLLVGAGIALLFQFMPSWWTALSEKVVVHARILLIACNVVALVFLILWRQWKK